MRPADVALRFTVGQKAVIVKNKFDQLNAEGMNFVKVPFTLVPEPVITFRHAL
jgi:hypothetical protein